MRTNRLIFLLLGLALAAIAWAGMLRSSVSDEPLGLFTSLPILWSEEGDVAAELGGGEPAHWARAVLARKGRVVALDMLDRERLKRLDCLILAQPRALAPEENVALDEWVRGGGRLLLFADPALTQESHLAISDPRRPQAMVMLSPILGRWGLELRFDDAQPFGESEREVLSVRVPVNLPGHFALKPGAPCELLSENLVARCAIGKGRVLVLADAALLEPAETFLSREAALTSLIDQALDTAP